MSPNFRKLVSGAKSGEVVIPVLRAALWNPNFKAFNIQVQGFTPRPPDNWFHPSTHPLWDERKLYYYLTEPERVMEDPFDPASTMAVTQGNFWHAFIERVGTEVGLFKGCEVQVEDAVTGARGSMDGVIDGTHVGLAYDEVFEFKSMRSLRAAKLPKGAPDDPAVLAAFRAMAPDYYAQGQEYLRLSGYRRWRGVILSLEYPFPLREIVMDYDPAFALDIRDKYLRVRQAVADQRLPPPCCAPRSAMAKECPARSVCEIGMI